MSLLVLIPSIVVALLTLTASLAAVYRVGNLKGALETAERAAAAWEDERDAAVAKAERLEQQLAELWNRVHELEDANRRLQERTDLSRYFDQQDANHHEVLDELHQVVGGVKTLAASIETLAVMLKPLIAAS